MTTRTQTNGKQIKDGSIQKEDLDITTTGKAVITKIIPGTGVSFSSTGADEGTGEVTINVSGAGSNIDGGRANEIYVAAQHIDGGGANG